MFALSFLFLFFNPSAFLVNTQATHSQTWIIAFNLLSVCTSGLSAWTWYLIRALARTFTTSTTAPHDLAQRVHKIAKLFFATYGVSVIGAMTLLKTPQPDLAHILKLLATEADGIFAQIGNYLFAIMRIYSSVVPMLEGGAAAVLAVLAFALARALQSPSTGSAQLPERPEAALPLPPNATL